MKLRPSSLSKDLHLSTPGFQVRRKDKQAAVSYYDQNSHSYDDDTSRGFLKFFRSLERKAVLEFMNLKDSSGEFIEVGCGSGFYALQAKKAGMKVEAMDLSPQMVKNLEGKVDRAFIGDIEQINLSKTYDKVVCAGVLDFVLNPSISFQNLSSLVSPGGDLIILAPRLGLGGIYYRIEKLLFGFRVNLYDLKWLRNMAQVHGLILLGHAKPLPTNIVVHFRKRSPTEQQFPANQNST